MVSKAPKEALPALSALQNRFFENISSTLLRYGGFRESRRLGVGLAISGGVDSMALSVLCSKVQVAQISGKRSKTYPEEPNKLHGRQNTVDFHAFVVDHGARPGSREEALKVGNVLWERGIKSTVLTIKWPEGIKPSALPNFETLARRYRFQALGKACRDRNLPFMFMAHHADDQAETVMMRILAGHRGKGLSGMSDIARIPECYGLYGVHRSGGVRPDLQSSELPFIERRLHMKLENHTQVQAFAAARRKSMLMSLSFESSATIGIRSSQQPPYCELEQMQIEYGGVRVIRPLLKWTKEELKNVCQLYKMPWFEDATNADPTLTMRNAIRHVSKNYTLPQAFAKDRLRAIASYQHGRSQEMQSLVTSRLQQFSVTNFEPRSGTMTVQFEREIFEPAQTGSPNSDLATCPTFNRQRLSLLVLRDVVDSVSPEEHIPLKNLIAASKIIFPEIYVGKHEIPTIPDINAFTVAGLKFQRCPTSHAGSSSSSDDTASSTSSSRKWLITRQPHFSDINKHPKLLIPPITSPGYQPSFELYDGRYWIKIENFTSKTMHVRPFKKEDMKTFRSKLPPQIRKTFNQFLKTHLSGDVRWTLPAIVESEKSGGNGVIALPSLGLGMTGVENLMRYEISYKEVVGTIRTEYESRFKTGFRTPHILTQ